LDDYLRWQRDIERLRKQSTEFSSIGSVDAEIRKITRPIHESLIGDTALSRVLRDAERMRELTTNIHSALLPASVGSLADSIERQRSWYGEYLGIAKTSPLETAYLFTRLQEDAGARIADFYAGSSLRNELYGAISSIHETAKFITNPPSSAALATAFAGWNAVFEDAHDNNGGTLERALTNPLAETVRHFAESSRMLVGVTDPTTARAIERSLLLTEAQLRTTAVSLAGAQPPDEPSALVIPHERRLLAPRVQRLELRRSTTVLDEDADLEDVLATIPIGQRILVAREVVAIVIELADSYMVSTPIFKITERVARVCAELPFAVPVDRWTFADFIDDLYWLLYESPGSGSLRYLTENGGPFGRDDCEIVFVIKRFRNYYRHDLEHGPERDIQKKMDAVREDLRVRGVQHLGSRGAYRTIHRVLLDETLTFLRKLHAAITS
jgi:hypothetical protein